MSTAAAWRVCGVGAIRLKSARSQGARRRLDKFSTAVSFLPQIVSETKIDHLIEVAAAKHKYAATYRGEHIGEWRVPECDAARWLLANGRAARDDMLVSCRHGRAALIGSVGSFADSTVEENEKVSPRWRKFRSFALKPADGPATVCGSAPDRQVEAA